MLLRSAGACVRAVALTAFWLSSVDLLGVSNAHAARLTNKDKRSYMVTVNEGSGSTKHDLGASETLEKFCGNGCVLILRGVEDGSYYLPEGNEIVSIEGGVLYYDGSVAAPANKDE